jgi:hypothetical protein
MVLAFALPRGEALHVKEVTVEARLAVTAAVPDFELHLPRRHRLAAHGTWHPVPRSAPCATRLHRWQLSTLDGFPCFLAEGGLVLHLTVPAVDTMHSAILSTRTSNRSRRIGGRSEKSARDDSLDALLPGSGTAEARAQPGAPAEARVRANSAMALRLLRMSAISRRGSHRCRATSAAA